MEAVIFKTYMKKSQNMYEYSKDLQRSLVERSVQL